jgi:RNA polymerase sigma-70 factor, ECF subfamily
MTTPADDGRSGDRPGSRALNRRALLPVLVDMTDAPPPGRRRPVAGSRAVPRPGPQGAACSGDAFRVLYRDHAGPLLAYAERCIGDRRAAEGALQETFLRAWHELARLQADDRPPRPWLHQVLHQILLDRARAARDRQTRLIEDAFLGRETASGYDALLDRHLLPRALEGLSPPHREVVVDIYHRDLPVTCVAAARGVPVGTVRSRLHHALNALRQQLTDAMEAPGAIQPAAPTPRSTRHPTVLDPPRGPHASTSCGGTSR